MITNFPNCSKALLEVEVLLKESVVKDTAKQSKFQWNLLFKMVRRFIVALLCISLFPQLIIAKSWSMPYAGRLVSDNGAPIEGPVDLSVAFFASEASTSILGKPFTFSAVELADGVFQVIIEDELSNLNDTLGSGNAGIWIEVTDVTHNVTYPRQVLGAVPFALQIPVDGTSIGWNAAGELGVLNTGGTDKVGGQKFVTAGAANGQVLSWDAPSKTWKPASVASPAILGNTSVVPGTYNMATITVDSQGRITSAANGSSSSLPSQTGNGGKFLTTDGSAISWAFASQWNSGAGNSLTYSSGNVGIGTSSPLSLLDVKGQNASSASALPNVLTVIGANNTNPVGGSIGAGIRLVAGSGNGESGTGAEVVLHGGDWANGGSISIAAGKNGGGGPGSVNIAGAFGNTSSNQNGGPVYISGGSGGPTDGDGGDIYISGGPKGGTGTDGNVILVSSTGNVGIGTTVPNSKLEVFGDMRTAKDGDAALMIESAGGALSGSPQLFFGSYRGTVALPSFPNDGDILGTILFGNQNSDFGASIQSTAVGNHRSAPNHSGGKIEFSTTPNGTNNIAVRMTISDYGRVGIGTTTPGYILDVNGDINIAAGNALRFAGASVCTSAGCTSTSDLRLKKDVDTLQSSLEKILKLRGVEFTYKDENKFGRGRQIGVIAQEIEEVYPEVVRTDFQTGFKAVAYDHLVAPILEAVKTLYERIKALESQAEEQDRQIYVLAKKSNQTCDEGQTEARILRLETENLKLKANARQSERESAAIRAQLERIEHLLKLKGSDLTP